MISQFEELLRAGLWFGPAVLGTLFYRLMSDTVASSGDDLPGAVMLALAAIIWTAAGVRFNDEKKQRIVPAVFALMFFASWYIR